MHFEAKPEVHWEEGMFLQPQHLQLLQAQLRRQFATTVGLLLPHAHGLLEPLKFAHNDLAAGTVRITGLRAVMPSGIVIDVGGNTGELTCPAALSAGRGSAIVYLSVGKSEARAPLIVDERDGSEAGARRAADFGSAPFSVVREDVFDENTGKENDRRTLSLRRVNARLLLDPSESDRARLDTIPLMRLVRGAGERPQLDATYSPPCLTLHAEPRILERVDALASEMVAARNDVAANLKHESFDPDDVRSILVEPLARLRTLSHGAATLKHALRAQQASPYAVFGMLLGIHAELAALSPSEPWHPIEYEHLNPLASFDSLCGAVRRVLRRVISSITKIAFTRNGRFHEASIPTDEWVRPALYLGITATGIQTSELARLVGDPTKFKIMPTSEKSEAWNGLRAVREDSPPPAVRHDNTHIFRLEPSDGSARVRWNMARDEQGISISWPDSENSNWELGIYLPHTERARR